MAEQVIPLAPQAEQPQPNMFANWGANPVGNWNKVMDKSKTPAAQFVGDKMKEMNIPDPQNPQPENVVPYAPGTTVAQPVSVPKTKQTSIKTTDSRPVNAGSETGGVGYVNPNSETAGIDALLYTSPEQEERLRKASVQRQRIYAIGDALRHIGNIYNTVNGAPSQKFNSPVEEERRRYLQEKAIRDQNNYKYMTYQQAKAAQEAKQKQFETQLAYNAARDAAKMQATKDYQAATLKQNENKWKQQLEFNQNKWKQQADLNERKLQQQERHNKRMEGIAGMNAKTARDRATAYINHLNKGGNANSLPLQTPNGSIYAPGKSIPQAQMNQMYKWAINNGYINQSEFQKKMAEAGFGKADPDYVRNQMVAEAMMEHGELADFARDNYGWTYGSGNGGGDLSIGWDDEDEEDNNGLSIGW